MSGYTEIREVAQGMYARKVCGSIMESIVPMRCLDVDFDFKGLVERAALPEHGDHKRAWHLFHDDFDKEFKNYLNNRK